MATALEIEQALNPRLTELSQPMGLQAEMIPAQAPQPSAIRNALESAGQGLQSAVQDPRLSTGLAAVLAGASDPAANVGRSEQAVGQFAQQQAGAQMAAGQAAAQYELEEIRAAARMDQLERRFQHDIELEGLRQDRVDARTIAEALAPGKPLELGKPVEIGGKIYEAMHDPKTNTVQYIETRDAPIEETEAGLIGPAKMSKSYGMGFSDRVKFDEYLEGKYGTKSISKVLKKAQESKDEFEYRDIVREVEIWTGVPLTEIDSGVSESVDELVSGAIDSERAQVLLGYIDELLSDVGGDEELLTPNTQRKLKEYYQYVESLSKEQPEQTGARKAGQFTREVAGGVSMALIDMLKESKAYKGGEALVKGGKAVGQFFSGLVTGE